MKFNWKGLVVWYFIFDFINDPLREVLLTGKTNLLYMFGGFQEFIIFLSGHLSFFLFGAFAYAGFYFFYPKKNYTICGLFIVVSFIVPILLRYLIQEVLFYHIFGFTNYFEGVTFHYYFIDNLYFAFRYVFFGIVYYFIQSTIVKERYEKELTIEKQKLELSLLRSQINPHFLLNTLNNIYSLIYQKSSNALKAMDKLSEILKYNLYHNKDNVKVKEELDIVNGVIELNRLRYDYPVNVNCNFDEGIFDLKIPPFIIVPLVENAFKHGNLRDPNFPVEVVVIGQGDQISIGVKNKIGSQKKDVVGGIGLENIKKRLRLIYGPLHKFEVIVKQDVFEVKMIIPGS